jgi:hypothetical protein
MESPDSAVAAEPGGGEAGGSEAGGSKAGGSKAGGSETCGSKAGGGEARGSEPGGGEAGGSESGLGEARKSAMPPARAGGLREIEVPDALQPLGEHERPTPLLVAVAVAAALAVGVCISVATVHDLARHGGSLPGGLFLAGVLFLLSWGMYQRRYWAVLGFEALLAFQIIVTSLALIVAETLPAAGLCLLSICLAGWLFWKLVRVMGRIQAGERGMDEAVG